MNHFLNHWHRRKIAKNQEDGKVQYPNLKIATLDELVMFVAVFGPLANIPQIIRVFAEKSAEGLSIMSWTFYVLFNVAWIAYGLIHKEKPIIISSSLWMLTQIIVLIGIVIY